MMKDPRTYAKQLRVWAQSRADDADLSHGVLSPSSVGRVLRPAGVVRLKRCGRDAYLMAAATVGIDVGLEAT